MKGIEKIGRSNGLCPYTPYEDLPASSKSLSDALKKVKPSNASRYQHPYYSVIYHYNDIVDDHNKFCTLSKDVLLLQTVKQPELFFVQYPDDKNEKPVVSEHKQEPTVVEKPPVAEKTVTTATTVSQSDKDVKQSQEPPSV